MRDLLIFCVALSAVYLVSSEPCTVASDCVATLCQIGNQTCEHPPGEGIQPCAGLCSCSAYTGCVHDWQCTPAEVTCKHNEHRECRSGHCECVKNHGHIHQTNQRGAPTLKKWRRQATNPCTPV